MRLGERLAVTLFGTSHGPCVGALLEGLPSGIKVDPEAIQTRMDSRRPGEGIGGKRRAGRRSHRFEESEECDGQPMMIEIANADVRSSDYGSF